MTRQAPRESEQQGHASGHSDVKGVYLWGGVGCGKTMLMDLFAESAPKQFYVRRMHFHDFMLDVHTQLRGLSGEQVRHLKQSCLNLRVLLNTAIAPE